MIQEHINHFHKHVNIAVQEFQAGAINDAIERLELLTIFFKEIQKQEETENDG